MSVELNHLARILHESMRETVKQRKCVHNLDKPFTEWDELTEDAREGRLIMAAQLLERVIERSHSCVAFLESLCEPQVVRFLRPSLCVSMRANAVCGNVVSTADVAHAIASLVLDSNLCPVDHVVLSLATLGRFEEAVKACHGSHPRLMRFRTIEGLVTPKVSHQCMSGLVSCPMVRRIVREVLFDCSFLVAHRQLEGS